MRLINRCFVVLTVVSTGLGTWQLIHPSTVIVMNEGSLPTSSPTAGSDLDSGLDKINDPILGKVNDPILDKDHGRLAADLFCSPEGSTQNDDLQSRSSN